MNRETFLRNEFIILTMIAGLATRNTKYPVYDKMVKDKEILKNYIRSTLIGIGKKAEYQNV